MIVALAAALALQSADALAVQRQTYDDAVMLVATYAACDEVLPESTWDGARRELVVAFDTSATLLDEIFAAHRTAVETQYSPTERRRAFTIQVCGARIKEYRDKVADGIWRFNRMVSETPLERAAH